MEKSKRKRRIVVTIIAMLVCLLATGVACALNSGVSFPWNVETNNEGSEISDEAQTVYQEENKTETDIVSEIRSSKVSLIVNNSVNSESVKAECAKPLTDDAKASFDPTLILFEKGEVNTNRRYISGTYTIPNIVTFRSAVSKKYSYNTKGEYILTTTLDYIDKAEDIAFTPSFIEPWNDLSYEMVVKDTPEDQVYEAAIIDTLKIAIEKFIYATKDDLILKDKYNGNANKIQNIKSEGKEKTKVIESPREAGLFLSNNLNQTFVEQLNKGIKTVEVVNPYTDVSYNLKSGDKPLNITAEMIDGEIHLTCPQEFYDEFIEGKYKIYITPVSG